MSDFCGICGRRDGMHEMWCKENRAPNFPYRAQVITDEGKYTVEHNASALDVQVAGGHYKNKKIQPVEYIHANGLNFLEGCIVKRITRWRDKPAEHRFQDLEKIKHEVDLLIEMEKRHG